MKRKRRHKRKLDCPYSTFILLFPYMTKEKQDEILERLKQQPRPSVFCGREVPKGLNSISYGMLDDLRTAAQDDDPAGSCAKILLGADPMDLLREDANDVFGFVSFVTNELLRINNIFKSIKVSYSKEEIAAGVRELDFGSFGILDWYARRMGITNQNEVRDVAWVRIFQCMKNDALKNEYERKLAKQYRPKKNGK